MYRVVSVQRILPAAENRNATMLVRLRVCFEHRFVRIDPCSADMSAPAAFESAKLCLLRVYSVVHGT